jgi:hypothetical protein
MNPIEFLQRHGLNPEEFRAVPLQVGVSCRDGYYNPKPEERPKAAPPGIKAVAAYMKSRRLENVSCVGIEPILPFLIADSFMLLNEEHLKGYDFTDEEKHFHNRLMEHYWAFNHSLYKSLDDETKGELADIVDEFSEYIAHDLTVFRYAIMGPLMHVDKEFRETYSVLAAARVLIYQTCRFYEGIYRVPGKGAHRNANLYWMERHVNKLVDEFVKRVTLDKVVNENEYESIRLATRCVNRRIVRFVKEYDRQSNG